MTVHRLSHMPEASGDWLLPVEAGDHLDQKAFHAWYQGMSASTRAELVEGVVYLPSPLRAPHGRIHSQLMGWLLEYQDATPGVDLLDNATVILGDDSEVQPDACLLIPKSHGGQAGESEDQYIVGAPELVAEVALSSRSYDLHSKRRAYEKAGVQEYLVLVVAEQQAIWFVREDDKFNSMPAGDDEIFRSRVLGGLWLDPRALFQADRARVREVGRAGFASEEHRRILERLKPQA